MEKLNKNELIACNGGNILTTFITMFNNVTVVMKRLLNVFGGRK